MSGHEGSAETNGLLPVPCCPCRPRAGWSPWKDSGSHTFKIKTSTPRTVRVCPGAAVTHGHKLGGFKHWKSILSVLGGNVHSPGGFEAEDIPCLSPAVGQLASLSAPWLVDPITPTSVSIYTWPSRCVPVFSPLFTRTPGTGIRDHPKSRMISSQLMMSSKTLTPDKVTLTGRGVRTW